MKNKETFTLHTGNTKRTMSYIEKDNKLLMITKANIKKIAAIKSKSIVKVDNDNADYIATISNDIQLMTDIKVEL